MSDGAVIRPALAGDLGYIFSTWLRDLRDADGTALEDDLWYPAHRGHVERVLADPRVVVHVLAAEDNHQEILGYIVAQPHEVLHWVQIRKGPLRGRGLAKRLLTAASVEDAPAAWTTPLGRQRLRNPWRGRKLRRRSPRLSTASPSER
jgi:hypothetical protein